MDGPRYVKLWRSLREVVLFGLGTLLVIHAIFGNGAIDRVIELTIGLILLGIVPIDVYAERLLGRVKGD